MQEFLEGRLRANDAIQVLAPLTRRKAARFLWYELGEEVYPARRTAPEQCRSAARVCEPLAIWLLAKHLLYSLTIGSGDSHSCLKLHPLLTFP
jgi:hypothetical protein